MPKNADIAALQHDGQEWLHAPDRVEPVLQQRIGHLRERNFQELNRFRINGVSAQPLDHVDVVDAVDEPHGDFLAGQIWRAA